LIIIDKENKNGKYAKLTDDIFHMFPDQYLTGSNIKWQDNKLVISVQAIKLKKMIKEIKMEAITDPDARLIIQKLSVIADDSNPVIFIFSVRDRVHLLN
jgi:hypothetical protein